MKNAIGEYIELTDKEKQRLWNNATFIFDANIFLKLYQITGDARKVFFDSLEKIKERIWMPYQTAYEFMKNRNKKILSINQEYNDLNKDIEDFIKKVALVFNISEGHQECCKYKKELEVWVEQHKAKNPLVKEASNDAILNQILDYFKNKVGKEFEDKDLQKIKEDGELRYKRHIPPGYKDANKALGEDFDNNKYGDLIFWKEILGFSKANKKDIIIITNDRKEDWWEIISGKTIGPRPELRKEFLQHSGQVFYMYTFDNFLKFSEKDVDAKIIDEVKSDAEDDKVWDEGSDNYYKRKFYFDVNIRDKRAKLKYLKSKLDYLYSEYNDLQEMAKSTHKYIYQSAAERKKMEIEVVEKNILIIRNEIRHLMIEEESLIKNTKTKECLK